MGFLADKILSYSPQVYYKFNEPYTTQPTNLGSAGASAFTNSNELPTQNVRGGVQATGSWKLNQGNGVADTTPTRYGRLATATNNATATLVDQDYSYGFWFKTNYTLSNSGVHPSILYVAQIGGSPTAFVRICSMYIGGGAANNVNKGKFVFSTQSSIISANRVDDQQWHYVAVVATPRDGNNVKYDYYLDGQFVGTQSPTLNTFGTLVYYTFGTTSVSSTTNYNEVTTYEIADSYIAPSASIGATQIAEIWAEGQKGFYRATKALPTQPEHWWPADENTSDLLLNYGSLGDNGNQNPLNLSGSSPANYSWVNGEVEKAIYLNAFSGYDQYASWDVDSTFTINFWFKKDAPPVSDQTWMYWYLNTGNNIDSTNEAGILTNGYLRFKPALTYSGGPYTQSAVETGMNVCDGNWHLITFTKNGATLNSYVDGQLKQTVTDWDPVANPNPAATFAFGSSNTYYDEFQLYDYTLSDAQILSLYQSEYPALAGYPLTYWNGSAWATPISMKQWNGTAWVTMDGSVYNGSAWVDIV